MKTTPELPEWCWKSCLGHGLLDADGVWVSQNPALCKILQRSAGDFVGQRLDENLDESNREIFWKAWEDVVSGVRPSRCMDLEFPASDGGRLFTDVFLTKFEEFPGTMMVQMLNITRHKENEIALAQANNRLRMTAAVAGMGYWEYDYKTKSQNWDDGVLRIYGIRREDFSGRWDTYVHPEDLERAERSVFETVEKGDSGEQAFRAVRPDGSIRHVHSIFTIERDGEGKPSRLTGLNFDIAELLERRKNLEWMLENIPVPALVVDINQSPEIRSLLLLNRKITETFGYTRDDTPTAQAWMERAFPDEGYRTMVFDWWRDALKEAESGDGLVKDAEFHIIAKDGTRRDVVHNAYLAGNLLLLALSDITEQKKSAAALEAAYRTEAKLRSEAERIAQARSRFLAGVSHEIRTPISALVNLSQSLILESEKHALPAEFQEHIEKVRSGGQYLNLILTNLLDVSAAESGHAPVQPQSFYLHDWVEDIGAIIEPIARGHSAEIIWRLPGDENEKFSTDAVRLSQILLNLAHNAAKFAFKPGTRIWISVTKNGSFLDLSVADEGPGIPPEKLEGLFKEFGQSDTITHPMDRGVGLGLAVVRQNVSLLGGKISTRPVEPSGICFEISLPELQKKTTA